MDCSHQAPPSMEFSRQEYWSGLPFPSPGDLPDPGIKPRSPALQADALPSEPPGKPGASKQTHKSNGDNYEENTMTSVGHFTNQYLKIVHSFDLDCCNDIMGLPQ